VEPKHDFVERFLINIFRKNKYIYFYERFGSTFFKGGFFKGGLYMPYLPKPPRVWSRVQSACTFLNPNDDYTSGTSVFTGQPVSYAQGVYQLQLLRKGNILQYKANSAQLTKKQRYTQLAKGYGPNRTKVFGTQSDTYTNPNTTGLLRVGGIEIPYPNFIVGQPNNPSGPYQYNVENPDNCNTNGSLLDGGTLVYGTYANPCSNQIIKECIRPAVICNSSTASDVPGRPVALCWKPSLESWFPKPRYVNNNSTDKWPVNYKGFVSAEKPKSPTIISLNGLTLSWTYVNSCVVPTTNFFIYVNDKFYTSVIYTITSYIFSSLNVNDTIYVIAVSRTIESDPSNSVVY